MTGGEIPEMIWIIDQWLKNRANKLPNVLKIKLPDSFTVEYKKLQDVIENDK